MNDESAACTLIARSARQRKGSKPPAAHDEDRQPC